MTVWTLADRLCVGVVFLAASVGKGSRLSATARSMAALLPHWLGRWPRTVAVAVVAVELGCGILLLASLHPRVTGGVAMAALAVFTVVTVRAIRTGNRAACACFGGQDTRPVGLTHVIRNVLLIAFCAYLMAVPQPNSSTGTAYVAGAYVAVSAMLVCACALTAVRLESLVASTRDSKEHAS